MRACVQATSEVESVFFGVSAIWSKNTWQKRFGTKHSVRCSEFGGGHFSEVAIVLHVWDISTPVEDEW